MLLLIEIALTVAAWRRGWRACALVPISLAVIAGILIGVPYGPDADFGEVFPLTVVVDGATIIALAAMWRCGRGVPAA